MEEIDPRAFNNGAEDSGLSIAHTYVNDGSNSKLYPPANLDRTLMPWYASLYLHFWILILIKGSIIEFLLKYLLQTLESVMMTEPQLQHCWVDFCSC